MGVTTCDGDCCRTTEDGGTVCLTTPTSQAQQPESVWHKMRGAVMLGVACITSPCCTPLIVPIILALLAGSPVVLWLGQHIGWVYGGLTLVSVVSFVLAWRWKFGARSV